MYKVYSFKDHRVTARVPALGRYLLSGGGIGRITVAYAGDKAAVTPTLDGNAIINKHHRKDGTIGIDVPQVGDANDYLKKWCNYVDNAATANFADGEITIVDNMSGETVTCIGVVPQKMADTAYDEDAQNRSWTLLAAEITIQ